MRAANDGSRAHWGMFALLIGGLVCPGSAEAITSLSVDWARQAVKGDFDDTIILVGPDAIYDIPRIDPGDGIRFGIGWGLPEFEFEVTYATTTHKAPGALRPDGYDTHYHQIGLDLVPHTGILRGPTGGLANVYLRIGGSFASLRIRESAADLVPSLFTPSYNGIGLTLGAGVEMQLLPGLYPRLEYTYRVMRFPSVESQGKTIKLEDRLSGSGSAVYAGMRWRH
jgi:opacity protein-like surface antigen